MQSQRAPFNFAFSRTGGNLSAEVTRGVDMYLNPKGSYSTFVPRDPATGFGNFEKLERCRD